MSEAITTAAAYDLIDRFLRNNLFDDDYAKYSDALEALSQPAKAGEVTDEQIMQRVLAAKKLFEPWATGQGYNLAHEDRGYMATYRGTEPEHAWRGYCAAILALRPAPKEPAEFLMAIGELSSAMGSPAVRGTTGDMSTPVIKLAAERLRAMRPQAVPMTPEQLAVLRFCWGSGTLDGLGFGDKHPELPGNFWWRNHLAEAFPGITAKAEGAKP